MMDLSGIKRYQDLAKTNAIPRQQLDTQVYLVAQDRGLIISDQAQIDTEHVPDVPQRPIVQHWPEPAEVTPELDAVVDALVAGWTSPKAQAEAELEASA